MLRFRLYNERLSANKTVHEWWMRRGSTNITITEKCLYLSSIRRSHTQMCRFIRKTHGHNFLYLTCSNNVDITKGGYTLPLLHSYLQCRMKEETNFSHQNMSRLVNSIWGKDKQYVHFYFVVIFWPDCSFKPLRCYSVKLHPVKSYKSNIHKFVSLFISVIVGVSVRSNITLAYFSIISISVELKFTFWLFYLLPSWINCWMLFLLLAHCYNSVISACMVFHVN